MTDSLVAPRLDSTTPLGGAFLLEDGEALVTAIRDGDWLGGSLAVVAGVADGVAMAVDPLGSLIATGLGWLVEHLNPLKRWFNELAGDADQVASFSQTWRNIGQHLDACAADYRRSLRDVEPMTGQTMDAYRRLADESIAHLQASATWSQAMADGLQIASAMVKVVHDLTRDCLAQVTGMAIAMVAEAVVTAGLAVPVIIAQVTAKVAALSARVSATLTGLVTKVARLRGIIDRLRSLFARAKSFFDRVGHGRAPEPSPSTERYFAPEPDYPPLRYLPYRDPVVPPNLTDLERAEIANYTGRGHRRINDILRIDGHPDFDEVRGSVEAIDSGLRKFPDIEGIVFRGTELSDDVLARYQPGEIVEMKGFTSTSALRDQTSTGNTFFTIRGKHGKDIRGVSQSPWEEEVLFPRNTKFRVISHESDMFHMIELEEID